MSSWVDRGFDAARCTRAPPAVRVRMSTAVSAVTCRQQATVRPANGCWRAKSARSMPSTGIARSAQAIPGRPVRASPGSAMSDAGTAACGADSGELSPDACRGSVPVVVGLVRAIDRYADVGGLLLGQLGEPHAERVQMQASDLLVEVLGQHVHAELVLVGL